jgi:hypothetical protein
VCGDGLLMLYKLTTKSGQRIIVIGDGASAIALVNAGKPLLITILPEDVVAIASYYSPELDR